MAARFRIRTSQGQEISFASLEMFAEFVRSGELSPDDVVFDAETKEWSSALTHPVVLQIESGDGEAREEKEAAAAAGDPAASAGGEATEDLDIGDLAPDAPSSSDIGLELAPAPDAMTPEQEQVAFVKKMEAERASQLDFDEEPSFEGFKMEQGSSGLVDGFSLVDEAETEVAREPVRPKREEPRRQARREEPRREASRREEPRRDEEPRWAKEPPKAKKKKKGGGALRRYAPLVIVGGMVVAAGVYFGPELLAPTTGEPTEATPDSAALPPPPAPLIPDTEEALRGRAQERFLTTTRALVRDLPAIPDIWLDGQYLAAPSDYPEVREAWNGVLTLVRQIRAGDNERYRAGYSRALDDAQVEGSARTLRLASAVAQFQGRVAPRAAHYDRVEALATAAVRGHDALVEAEGTIAYEPATGSPVSGDPVIQAVGRDPAAQALLNEVLDMILAQLGEPDGPGRAQNLDEWMWSGILDAVTG